jgi:predicted nicotinamide N-methyase
LPGVSLRPHLASSIVRPPGIVASRLGAKRVTLTDLPSELPLLRRNVAANANASASVAGIDDGGEETWSYGDHQSDAGTKLRVMPCAWGDDAALASLGTYDVVLCSDALYQNDEETQAKLARTLSQVRSTQKFFTHRPVSTFDRVPVQLTGECFLYSAHEP